MKICLLATATPRHQTGGTEIHAETLARFAAARGHEVYWLTSSRPEGAETEERDGYRLFYLPGTDYRMSRRSAPVWWRESFKKINELRESGGLDVIWAENLTGQYYAAFAQAGDRVPLISIIQGPGIRGEILSNWNRAASAKEFLWFFTRYAAQTLFYFIPWFRRVMRNSDRIVTISDECVSALSREFPGSIDKISKIYDFVDTSVFRPDAGLREAARRSMGIRPDEKALIMAGVAHRQKGFHIGINAFELLRREVPGARLIIAGDGPELGGLKALVSGKGLADAVVFRGRVEHGELPALYNAADLHLNPTLRFEGLALVIPEAMACGLPCVVSRIGGTGSTIEDGRSGFFTRPGDAAGMAEKAAALLKDPALAAAMGRAARERALREFSEKNIDSYIELSAELIKAGK